MSDIYVDAKKPKVVEPVMVVTEKDKILADNQNKDLWQWVEVPETDMFDDVHTGVNLNFVEYGPGKHFVNPETAGEIRRLLAIRAKADLRVLSPKPDALMKKIMNRGSKAQVL